MFRRAPWRSVLVLAMSAAVAAATLSYASRPSTSPHTIAHVAAGLAALLVVVLAVLADTLSGAAERAGASSEVQYRRVVEQIEQVVFQLDRDGRWVFLNGAWRGLTGLDVEAVIGRPVIDFLHPDDQSMARTLCEALLDGRADHCEQDLRFLTAAGSVRWASVQARPLREADALIGVAGTIVDIGARRDVQHELERAREAAEQASVAKTEFLKAMSHDMRTPLNGVLGLMDLLGATTLDEQQSRYVAVARASATHLSMLIADILDLSRLEAGALTLERDLYDLPDLIESNLDVVSAKAAAKRLHLSCTLEPEVPTWVIGDPGRLRQVIVNLLANAVKFTERGEVHLHAGATVDLQARRASIRLEVRDTGIGIKPERLERLFQPFLADTVESSRPAGGPGLGLTIGKRLVDAMGGTIEVHSVEHEGSTFVAVLPVELADAALIENHRQGEMSLRLLAVLPSQSDRDEIGRLLEGWRFDTALVADCETAHRHVEATTTSRWRFGVVVLDGLAPGAASLSRRLRALARSPGIVWITPADGRLPADVSGVRERVTRPVSGAALFDAIMQAAVGTVITAPNPSRPVDGTRRLRVLVAEDHDINQMVVRELLQSMHCDVTLVADGQAAVAAALAAPYDVILMDCRMPVLDGLEATRRIRQAYADGQTTHTPRIVALTANATEDDRRACLDAGMDAYLTKPMRAPVLQRTLQRLMAGEASPAAAGRTRLRLPSAPPADDGALVDAPDAEDILDPGEILLRCNRNADLGARMLRLFADSLPAELEALESAAVANDMEALGHLAHRMRGAAATLAAVRLAGAITGIELYLKYGDGGPLTDLVAEVRHESALLLGVVPQTLRQLATALPSAPTSAPAP